jgi:hypothetical protein
MNKKRASSIITSVIAGFHAMGIYCGTTIYSCVWKQAYARQENVRESTASNDLIDQINNIDLFEIWVQGLHGDAT